MLPGVHFNRYAYAGSDPVNGMDPSGHWMEGRDADQLSSMSNEDRKDYVLETQILRESKELYDNYPDENKETGFHVEYGNAARQQLRQTRRIEQQALDAGIEYGSYAIGAGAGVKLGIVGVRAGFRAAFSVGKERVFWSGGGLAKDAAARLATQRGATTLEQTPAGKLAESTNGAYRRVTGKNLPGRAWDGLSKTFSKTADQAKATVVINQAEYRGAASIWERVEQKALSAGTEIEKLYIEAR